MTDRIPQEWIDAAMDAAVGEHLEGDEEFHGGSLDFDAAIRAVLPLHRKQVLDEVGEAVKPLFDLRDWCRKASLAEGDGDGISGVEAYKIVAGCSWWSLAAERLSNLSVEGAEPCQCDDEGPWATECLKNGCRGPVGSVSVEGAEKDCERPRCGGNGEIEVPINAFGDEGVRYEECPGCPDCGTGKKPVAPEEVERRRVQFKSNGHLGTVIGEAHGLLRVVWDKASREMGKPMDSWVQPAHIETLRDEYCNCAAGHEGEHWAPCPLAEPTAESQLAELPPAEVPSGDARRFTLAEFRKLLSLRDVQVEFARRRFEADGRGDFDASGPVRYSQGVQSATADLSIVADLLTEVPPAATGEKPTTEAPFDFQAEVDRLERLSTGEEHPTPCAPEVDGEAGITHIRPPRTKEGK